MRRKPSKRGDPAIIRAAGAGAYTRPIVYRTRRRTLRRLVIPAGLAAIMVGAAIGAAASYLTAPTDTAPEHGRASRPAPSSRKPAPSEPASTSVRPGTRGSIGPSPGRHKASPVPSSTVATGEVLNDQGYALIQHADYGAAIPLLRRAVSDLRGVGPTDPYEAYANYNLGYALLQVGDCYSALAPLEAANRLETSPLVDVAIRRAAACAGQGS